jgi:hypothetical protein
MTRSFSRNRFWLLALVLVMVSAIAGLPASAACAALGAPAAVTGTEAAPASCEDMSGCCCEDAPSGDPSALRNPGCACAIEAPPAIPPAAIRTARVSFAVDATAALPSAASLPAPSLRRTAATHPLAGPPERACAASTPSRGPPSS